VSAPGGGDCRHARGRGSVGPRRTGRAGSFPRAPPPHHSSPHGPCPRPRPALVIGVATSANWSLPAVPSSRSPSGSCCGSTCAHRCLVVPAQHRDQSAFASGTWATWPIPCAPRACFRRSSAIASSIRCDRQREHAGGLVSALATPYAASRALQRATAFLVGTLGFAALPSACRPLRSWPLPGARGVSRSSRPRTTSCRRDRRRGVFVGIGTAFDCELSHLREVRNRSRSRYSRATKVEDIGRAVFEVRPQRCGLSAR